MTDWARRVMDEVDGALPPAPDPYPEQLDNWERAQRGEFVRARFVGDARTGYATENVVPVTTAEQDATLEWIEAIHWATGEDVR